MTDGFDERICETFTAPTNIAVIKYWGKKDVKLNTPLNSSVSVTLDQNDLRTITTAAASPSFCRDRMWLNGIEININNRMKTCIAEIRRLATDRLDTRSGETLVKQTDWPQYYLHIASWNTFPTGAGLASSAAGMACLVTTLAKLYNAQEEYPGQFTAIARQGSGSASRSMFGGFVRWEKGVRNDGADSIAVQVADENYWPELRVLILVVNDQQKDTSSTAGMELSRCTSTLLAHRVEHVIPDRLKEIEAAYLKKDFNTFGRLVMQDSNQFHAICMDSYPPIFYINDTSRLIIKLVHALNSYSNNDSNSSDCNNIKAAYTFDAGPNAVIYTTEEHCTQLIAVMAKYFPAPLSTSSSTNKDSVADMGKYESANCSMSNYCNKPAVLEATLTETNVLIPAELTSCLDAVVGKVGNCCGEVKYMYITQPGPGPINRSTTSCEQSAENNSFLLLSSLTGLPKANPGVKHQRMKM